MKYDVVTIGDASEDIFIKPEGARANKSRSFVEGKQVSFELGEKIPIEKAAYSAGGSALNTAVGFARLGLNTSTIVALGEDRAGDHIKNVLSNEGVDSSNIVELNDFETHFSIILSVQGERTIFVYRSLKEYDLLSPRKSLKAKWFYVGPMGDDAKDLHKCLIAKVCEQNSYLAWNPGSLQIDKGAGAFRDFLKNVSILFVNKTEAIKFAKARIAADLDSSAKTLLTYGPSLVVVTDGKNGAFCFDGKSKYKIDALEVEKLDSTGAGDAFACGFLSKIQSAEKRVFEKENILEALKWGILNSSSVVGTIGAQEGLLSVNKIEDQYSRYPRLNASVL